MSQPNKEKITFGEMRETGVRHVLIYCAITNAATTSRSAPTAGLIMSGCLISSQTFICTACGNVARKCGRSFRRQAWGRVSVRDRAPWLPSPVADDRRAACTRASRTSHRSASVRTACHSLGSFVWRAVILACVEQRHLTPQHRIPSSSKTAFVGRLLRLAMIGRPQWQHGDRDHHSLMSGKPGKHAAQTRMMQPGHFRPTQGWL